MEAPLLNKSEHIIDVTISGDSSSTPHEVEGVERCNPCTRRNVLNLIDFVLILVQIVAAFLVVTRAKDEHPQTLLFVMIIGYTCLCIATLPILCWRFWQYNRCVSSETRIVEVMNFLKETLEYFFVGWIVALLWIYPSSSSSLNDSTQHFWLCVAFLASSCILYVPTHLKFSAVGLIFAVLIWINAINEDITGYLVIIGVTVVCIFLIIDECCK